MNWFEIKSLLIGAVAMVALVFLSHIIGALLAR